MIHSRFKKRLSMLMSVLLIFSLFSPINMSMAEGQQGEDYSVQFLEIEEANYQGFPVGALITKNTTGAMASLDSLTYKFKMGDKELANENIEKLNANSNSVNLLGYFNLADIAEGEQEITLEGYDGETKIIDESITLEIKSNVAGLTFSYSAYPDVLAINIQNEIFYSKEDINGKNVELTLISEKDNFEIAKVSANVVSNPDYYQGYELYKNVMSIQANATLNTHIVDHNETFKLVVEIEGIDPFEFEGQSIASKSININLRNRIFAGDREFSADIFAQNFPSKDYFDITVIEKDGENEIVVAEAYETHYTSAYVEGISDSFGVFVKFRVLEGKSLDSEKKYYFKFEAEGEDLSDFSNTSFEVEGEPTITKVDLSKLNQSKLILYTALFDSSKEYEIKISEVPYQTESPEPEYIALGNDFVEDGIFEFDLKDANGTPIAADLLKKQITYYVQIKDSSDFIVTNYPIAIYDEHSYITSVKFKELSKDTTNYFEKISIYGSEFIAADIESIELVDPENEDVVIANLQGDIFLENQFYMINLHARMQVIGEPVLDKDYIYVIKLKDGREIRPNYNEMQDGITYLVTLKFIDAIQINEVDIFDSVQLENTGPYQMTPMPMNDRYMELSSDKLKFELSNILNLKEEDVSNIEVELLDNQDNVIASMDKSTIEVMSEDGVVYSVQAEIGLEGLTLQEDIRYKLSVKYLSNLENEEFVGFTDDLVLGTFYKDGEMVVEKNASFFEMVASNTLNFNADDVSIVLSRTTPGYAYDFTNSFELECDITQDEDDIRRYYLATSLEEQDIPVGYYGVFLKHNGAIVQNPKTNIIITDKSMVLSGSEYTFEEGFVKEYIINAVNLQREASYKVYIYPGYFEHHYPTSFNGHYSPEPELLMSLDSVAIDEKGNVIFTAEELKDLEEGSYSLFFEMNNKIIGQGYLNIKEYHDIGPKASFMINGGRKVTDNAEVSLQIMLGNYSHIRFAESETMLQNSEYSRVTEEELAAKIAIRNFMLSSGFNEKTIYLQLKDDDGYESEILNQKISLEPEILEKPFDLKYEGNNPIVENDTIVIEAKGKANLIAKASLLNVNGEIISTITLPNTGQDTSSNYIFRRSVNIAGSLINIKTVRVYFENSLGTKSEYIDLTVNVDRLAKVDGILSKTHAGETKVLSSSSVILEKKSGDSFIRVGSRTTDKDGKFTFTGMVNGDYRFVTYNGGVEYTSEFTIAGSDREIEFTLTSEFDKSQSIQVILEDNAGTKLSGKNIAIGSSRTATYQNKATDVNGIALFENLPTKDGGVEYYVSTYIDGLSDWKTVNLQSTTQSQVTLKLPQVSIIKGKVSDRNGMGLKDVTVYANSPSFRYSYAYTDAQGNYELKILDHNQGENYRVQVSLNSGSKLFPVETRNNVSVDTENVDFTLYPGVSVYGDIRNASGQPVSNIQVYASSTSQWNRAVSDTSGNFDFGDVFGVGNHTVSAWVDGQQVSANIEITLEDLTNPSSVSKKVELRAEDRTTHPFKDDGNSVRSNVNSTQKEKQFTVKASIKNNSTRSFNNVNLEATLPNNVVLVNTPGFENVSTKNLGAIATGASGEMTMILTTTEDFDSSSAIIPVKVTADGTEYNLGFAEIEVVNITITGPSLSRSGNIKVYGETVENGKVTIIDKTNDKALSSEIPSGKWYASSLTLSEGNHEIVAMVEKDNNIAYSEILKVNVSASDGIEVEDVEIVSPGGQKIGVNRRTGIAAFSVWVDSQLRGKEISASVKLSASPGIIQEAKYSFAGKEYTATLEDNYYKAKITGWSASTIQKLKLFVKVEGQWIEFSVADITILIDPSGYVEDKYSLERLSGALAICEVWDTTESKWVFWDAEIYGQVNPQLTDENGEYGWMVPDGKYRVKITKDGYEDYVTTEDPKYSESGESTIIIPPPRDDVFISMINTSQPTVSDVKLKGNVITFELNKAIDNSTVNSQTVIVKDDTGAPVAGSLTLSTDKKTIIFTASSQFGSEKQYSLSIEGVMDFASEKTTAKNLVYVGTITSEQIITPGGGGSVGGGGGGGAASTGTTIKAKDGGTIKSDGILIAFLSDSLGSDFKVSVEKLTTSDKSKLSPPQSSRFASDVFEVKKDIPGKFNKSITITIEYSSSIDLSKENLSLFWLDESKNEWVELQDVKIDKAKRTISGSVDHFTKFAAIAKSISGETIKEDQLVKFSDIKGHWAESSILELVKLGAINGYQDGTFKPNRNITRAEFASVLVNSLGLKTVEGKVFNDTKNHWAKDAIATAHANGIVSGYNANTFGANDLVTREQMAAMIVNAFKLKSQESMRAFTDESQISLWAKESIDIASSNNVIGGYPNGNFGPKQNATRAEAAAIVVKALMKK